MCIYHRLFHEHQEIWNAIFEDPPRPILWSSIRSLITTLVELNRGSEEIIDGNIVCVSITYSSEHMTFIFPCQPDQTCATTSYIKKVRKFLQTVETELVD
jgi:hypothetical protein